MLRTSLAALLLFAPCSAFACGMAMAEDDRMLASVFDEIDNAQPKLDAAKIAEINANNEQLAQQAVAKHADDAKAEPAVVDAAK